MTICKTCGASFEKERSRDSNCCSDCVRISREQGTNKVCVRCNVGFETDIRGKKAKYCDQCEKLVNLERHRQWMKDNIDQIREYERRYIEENRDIYNAKKRVKYSVRRNDPSYIERLKRNSKLYRDKNKDSLNSHVSELQRESYDITSSQATQHYQKWTDEEINFIRENAQDMVAEDIALSLGRTVFSVWTKAWKEGISLRGLDKGHCYNGIVSERAEQEGRSGQISEFVEIEDIVFDVGDSDVGEIDDAEEENVMEEKDEHRRRVGKSMKRKKVHEVTKRHIFRKNISG